MSHEAISLTIYCEKTKFPIDPILIRKMIYKELSSAPIITTTLDRNDIDVMQNKWDTELKLEKARPKKIEKFFERDIVYEAIKSIDFQFKDNDKGQISFKLFPIFGEEIDDDLHDTRLDDFEILGYLSYQGGTYGYIDDRFFELGENIIRMLPQNLTKDDHLISFKGFDNKTDIMNSTSFYKRVIDLKNEYCNNPNLRK